MSFEEQIQSNCGTLPHDRIRISRLNELELSTIGKAVLFVFATWSGAAVISFRLLCEALAKNSKTKISLIVIDADGFNFDAFKSVLGEQPHGKGEAFWIKCGQIVARDRGYTHESSDGLQARINFE